MCNNSFHLWQICPKSYGKKRIRKCVWNDETKSWRANKSGKRKKLVLEARPSLLHFSISLSVIHKTVWSKRRRLKKKIGGNTQGVYFSERVYCFHCSYDRSMCSLTAFTVPKKFLLNSGYCQTTIDGMNVNLLFWKA